MSVTIKLRRGTTAQWSSANPTLALGEVGVDTDLKQFKVGNGSTPWNSLAFSTAPINNPAFSGSGSFAQNLTVNEKLYVGDDAQDFESITGTLTNSAATFRFDSGTEDSSYAQVAFQNADPTSSTDIITYMDTGDDSEGWMGIGITGSEFDDATYGITGPGDAYIFHQTKSGASPAHTGNLVIATGENGSQNKIVFAAGGYDSGDTQMEITPGVNVHIEIPTPSTSPSTGALTVVGGVGIQGDVNIQGTITFGGEGTTVETSNLSVEDPIVFTGTNNSGDSLDLGLVGKYVTGGNTKYAGVVRDATDGVIKFFKDASTQPTSTVNFAEAGLGYASIKVDGIDASGTVSLPSTTSIGLVSATEIGYLDGVSSAIQTQLNDKAPLASPTFTGNVSLPSTTAIGTVSSTEIGYLDGVTSSVQTQLDAKAPLASPTFTGTVTLPSTTSIGNVSNIEIGYLDGVTSAIQTQINSKLSNNGGDTITVSSGTTVPLIIQNNGTGNSFVVNDEASDATPFVIDAIGEVGIGTSSPQAFLDVKNGTTYSATGNFLTKIQQNANSPGMNGLSVMNAWASANSTIFEVAMGWNGSVAGYYPVFTIDGNGNISTLNPISNSQQRIKLNNTMILEAPVVINSQTGTSYTLVLADAGKAIEMNNAAANTLAVPTDASVNFPVGTVIDIFQTGAGQTTVGGAGVTINARPGLKLSGQWATATLIKRAANTWLLTGSLSA